LQTAAQSKIISEIKDNNLIRVLSEMFVSEKRLKNEARLANENIKILLECFQELNGKMDKLQKKVNVSFFKS
jgi:hypothetical protein